MTSRERVLAAIDHHAPDRVPLDLGGSVVSGMHASSVYALRQALELDAPGTPVRVVEPFQMLGEIAPDLLDALAADVVPVAGPRAKYGFPLADWKPWTLFDGTPVLVPGAFNTDSEPDGDILQYPQGDRSAPPSARMPKDGWYFDCIVRQPPIDEDALRVEDNTEEFAPISDADVAHFAARAKQQRATGRAVLGGFGWTSFGDIANVPAAGLKHPKGIRDIAEWYMSIATRRDFVRGVFERQCEIGLANLARVAEVARDDIDIVLVTGADFGSQAGPLASPATYRNLFRPFHTEVNAWIHRNTPWKTMIHSCGAISALIEDFIAAGFDILNPVQTSAAGMDARALKERFGDRICFWGGGIDTQQTLPFGTPDQVRAEVWERIATFGASGGYVFNPIHNVQACVPVENLLAMYETVREAAGR
jgi:hypothetical protein